ncbi:Hypothetical protein R9X50_00469500 [Acrodontium crateriforme]|uniref:F-box domain-containing protein n=1 Tax=Acrodontium crateriforme TaxID=150365 RepID=A0AAQ3M8D6_9PEZI|nr:Hypothetical protein R9X50_00469500 [Acrodontium crateriforme]
MAALVFSNALLLDLILGSLPPVDLLLVQRVCHSWRHAVQSSRYLLRKLFLHPGPASDPSSHHQSDRVINPLLAERFPAFFSEKRHGKFPGSADNVWQLWSTCPWVTSVDDLRKRHLDRYYQPPPFRSERGGASASMREAKPDYRLNIDEIRAAAYLRPEASWKKMIPVLPAPFQLQMALIPPEFYRLLNPSAPPWPPVLRSVTYGKSAYSSHPSGHTESQPWLTFGFLYHMIETAWFRNQPLPISWVQIHYDYEQITFQPKSVTPQSLQAISLDDSVLDGVATNNGGFNFDEHLWPGFRAEHRAQSNIDPRRQNLIKNFADNFPGQSLGGPGRIVIVMQCLAKDPSPATSVDRNCMQAFALEEFHEAEMWPSDKENE